MTSLQPETVEQFDVLAMGCVAVDDFLYVPEYPSPESKIRVTRGRRRCGGLAGGALQAAARLGARTGYGATLGDDELSRFVADRFLAEGISLTYLRRLAGVRPIHSTIIVDTTHHTRTVFFSLDGAQGAQEDWPPQEAIEASKVLFVDHYGIEGMIRAAKIARTAGIPVVADFERNEWPGFDELLALVDHLIISETFAGKLTGEASSGSRLALAIACRTAGNDGRRYLWLRRLLAQVRGKCGGHTHPGLPGRCQRQHRLWRCFSRRLRSRVGQGHAASGPHQVRIGRGRSEGSECGLSDSRGSRSVRKASVRESADWAWFLVQTRPN